MAPTAGPTVAQLAEVDVTGARGEAGADRPTLRRCTHLAPDVFAERVWGRECSLSTREQLRTGFDDLLDLDTVDHLISRQGLRTPFLRVARDGQTFSASRFTRSGGVGATIADQVDDAALARLFADGATIVLQGLHRTHPPLIDFAQALTRDLGHPVQVNAYVTPAQARGFGDHYDVHDVFVLQVAGQKRWIVHEPVLRHPTRDQPWGDRRAAVEAAARTDPVLDVVLRPGDALYLPAGFVHAAQALGETSAHLTVGVHVWSRTHLLAGLLHALEDVEALRVPLPLGIDVTDPGAVGLELQETIDSLRAALQEDAHVGPVVRRLRRLAEDASRAEPVGPVALARALSVVDLGTRLRWRRSLAADVEVSGGEIVVATAETTLTLPTSVERGLRRLLAGDVLSVSELASGDDDAMDDAARLDVARTLLRSAVVTTE